MYWGVSVTSYMWTKGCGVLYQHVKEAHTIKGSLQAWHFFTSRGGLVGLSLLHHSNLLLVWPGRTAAASSHAQCEFLHLVNCVVQQHPSLNVWDGTLLFEALLGGPQSKALPRGYLSLLGENWRCGFTGVATETPKSVAWGQTQLKMSVSKWLSTTYEKTLH